MKGLLVGFQSRTALDEALGHLTAADIGEVETYTPTPPTGSAAGSPLPLIMFAAGVLGFLGFFLLMTYADVRAYPLDIGGRPTFAWPTFVPIAFELGVLCAMAAGFFGYFVLCRMPHLYDPIDECESFRQASRNGWFMAIRTGDPKRLARVRSILEQLQPTSLEDFLT
jgi:hypothetical protein